MTIRILTVLESFITPYYSPIVSGIQEMYNLFIRSKLKDSYCERTHRKAVKRSSVKQV